MVSLRRPVRAIMPRRGKRFSRLSAATGAAEAAGPSSGVPGDTGGSGDSVVSPPRPPDIIVVSDEQLQKRGRFVLRYKEGPLYRTVQHRPDRPLTPDAARSGTMSRRSWEIACAEWRSAVRLMAEQMTTVSVN